MAVDLTKSLRWKTADKAVLEDLQGNILKGHGREHTINLFLRFDKTKSKMAKAFVHHLALKVTSSLKQLEDTEIFRITRESGDPFVTFFLTNAGYKALGVVNAKIPTNQAFTDGLKLRGAGLIDAPVDAWDSHFQEEIHAMVLIAENDEKKRREIQSEIISLMNEAVTIVGEEIGLAMKNENLDGIEHFGMLTGVHSRCC